MESILKEVQKLRKDKPSVIDRSNGNRYRVVIDESDGTKTAYYFGVPIYNVATANLVDLKFKKDGNRVCYVGTDVDVTLEERAILKNQAGQCQLSLPEIITAVTDKEAICGESKIIPTLNGLAFMVRCNPRVSYRMSLISENPLMTVRANNKSFSLMISHFRPFMTVSCIGTLDGDGTVVAPCVLEHNVLNGTEYILSLKPTGDSAQYILFEVNLYEPKLFLDTTVESSNQKQNNAFGTTAYLGNTAVYGHQWLYSRPELSIAADLFGTTINKIVMHLPCFNYSKTELSAYRVSSRFCSFGSNWENKVPASSKLTETTASGGYISLNITELLTNPNNRRLIVSDGLILRSEKSGGGFAAVSTGDSCYAPQIFEVNFI